jgi:hypothetical protein
MLHEELLQYVSFQVVFAVKGLLQATIHAIEVVNIGTHASTNVRGGASEPRPFRPFGEVSRHMVLIFSQLSDLNPTPSSQLLCRRMSIPLHYSTRQLPSPARKRFILRIPHSTCPRRVLVVGRWQLLTLVAVRGPSLQRFPTSGGQVAISL